MQRDGGRSLAAGRQTCRRRRVFSWVRAGAVASAGGARGVFVVGRGEGGRATCGTRGARACVSSSWRTAMASTTATSSSSTGASVELALGDGTARATAAGATVAPTNSAKNAAASHWWSRYPTRDQRPRLIFGCPELLRGRGMVGGRRIKRNRFPSIPSQGSKVGVSRHDSLDGARRSEKNPESRLHGPTHACPLGGVGAGVVSEGSAWHPHRPA